MTESTFDTFVSFTSEKSPGRLGYQNKQLERAFNVEDLGKAQGIISEMFTEVLIGQYSGQHAWDTVMKYALSNEPVHEILESVAAEYPDEWNSARGSHSENKSKPGKTKKGRKLVTTTAADITPKRVAWLWDGRMALGTLSLIAGREGLGKSTIAYTLAAQVTNGTMEGEYLGSPKPVIVCATEDSWEHTIVPRLMAAGADLELVHNVGAQADGYTTGLDLPEDVEALEVLVTDIGAVMLILDPLLSRLNSGLDTHKDSEVRSALEPLVAMADRTGLTIVGLIHHNKSGSSDPLQVTMASRAFTAVARSVHSVVPDPDDETEQRRFFGTPKNNLGKGTSTLAFHITGYTIPVTGDSPIVTGKVNWDGVVDTSIRKAMESANANSQVSAVRSRKDEAKERIREYLEAHDGEAPSSEVKAAMKDIPEPTVNRARGEMKDLTVAYISGTRTTKWVLTSADDVPEDVAS